MSKETIRHGSYEFTEEELEDESRSSQSTEHWKARVTDYWYHCGIDEPPD